MATTMNGHPTIIRTERGLSVAGTRITLYTILEYLHADWPPKLIQQWLDLSEQQWAGVLVYLDEHREEVEQEYQQVLRQADTLRTYWEKRLQDHLAQQMKKPLTAEQAILRAKFQTWKTQRQIA